MRQDHAGCSTVLNLAAMIALAAPPLGVLAAGGLDPGSSRDVIAVSAGVWVAAACRAAAALFGQSRQETASPPVRSSTPARRRRLRPVAVAPSPGLG